MTAANPIFASGASQVNVGFVQNVDLGRAFVVLWHYKLLILAITAAVTCTSYFYIGTLIPRYTAEAVILLNSRNANLGIDPVVSELRQDDFMIQSEVDVLLSRSLARRVVLAENLLNDPEFLEDLGESSEASHEFAAAPAKGNAPEPAATQISTVIDRVLHNLTATNDGHSFTIHLYYDSEDPGKAARIVNAFATHYLAGQTETKYEAAERGATWLRNKISELRDRVRIAETGILEYRREHSLLNFGHDSAGDDTFLVEKRLEKLSDELIAARGDRLRAETRLNEILTLAQSARAGSLAPGISDWPQLDKLLDETRAVEAERTQVASTYGDRHPIMLESQAQLDRLRIQLERELARIVESARSNARLAAAQEASFQEMIDDLEASNVDALRDEVPLRQLVSEAAAARSLLDTFLESLDLTSLQLDLVRPDARILSYAEPPTRPSFPQEGILLALALLGSLIISGFAVFVFEFVHKGFRAAEEIERAFGVPVIGMVPSIRSRSLAAWHPSSYALHNPLSTFTESVRLVRSATQLSRSDRKPRVVLVTSALPDEGKTVLSLTLGRLGASTGQKIMLIDCDLRASSVARDLKVNCELGLAEVLAGEAALKDVIWTDSVSGMFFVPAGRCSFDAIERLSSERLDRIISAAAQISDTVILDSPPVTVVSDPIILSRLADMTLMVVRWDHTPRSLVAEAMKRLSAVKGPPTGVVLSQVDLARHASYRVGDFPHGHLKGYLFN